MSPLTIIGAVGLVLFIIVVVIPFLIMQCEAL